MDKLTYNLLKLYNDRETLSLDQITAIYNKTQSDFEDAVHWLHKEGYIEIDVSDYLRGNSGDKILRNNTICKITFDGKIALEAESSNRNYKTFNEIRAWITLGIAAFGLAISIWSLILQF